MKLCFSINTGTLDDVLSHLHRCDLQFVPPLSSQVKLCKYATKIFENAYRYEAWLESSLIGMVAVYHNNHRLTGYITYVGIESSYSKNKIGTTLLNTAINEARNKNLTSLELQVTENNSAAISLYKKFSFHKTRTHENSFFMQKEL